MNTIPLYTDRSYTYPILLNSIYWKLDFLWNPRNQQWSVSIAYNDTNEYIISNVPLVAGIDILSQYSVPSTSFGKLLLWNDDWNAYIEAGKKPEGGFQDMGFSDVSSVATSPESGAWQLNLNPVSDYTLYYFLPDEDIPDTFSFTPAGSTGDAIVTKIVYPGWSPA